MSKNSPKQRLQQLKEWLTVFQAGKSKGKQKRFSTNTKLKR